MILSDASVNLTGRVRNVFGAVLLGGVLKSLCWNFHFNAVNIAGHGDFLPHGAFSSTNGSGKKRSWLFTSHCKYRESSTHGNQPNAF